MNTFTDKKSYIVFVSEWKNQYEHLSKNIRRFKKSIRKSGYTPTWQEDAELRSLKIQATDMLALRKQGKEQAQLMWLMQNTQ